MNLIELQVLAVVSRIPNGSDAPRMAVVQQAARDAQAPDAAEPPAVDDTESASLP